MPLPKIIFTVEPPPTCIRCGRSVSLLSLVSYNKQTKRCSKCDGEVTTQLTKFRQFFLQYCADGVLHASEWASLRAATDAVQIEWGEALAFIRGDALTFLERTLAFMAADGVIAEAEERDFHQLREQLALPTDIARPLLRRLQYLKELEAIRRGILPTVTPCVHLESDERCHYEADVVYRKVTAKSIIPVPGRLTATNKQLHFSSASEGGWVIKLKTILRVETGPSAVNLELSTKRGNGRYEVPDAALAAAIIDTLVRLDKRQLIAPSDSEGPSRHIPQDIKNAVWQRDQGKCVQCGDASYLEFDHIIPFSKGGASTVGNVQLLCRRCNLTKGDRI